MSSLKLHYHLVEGFPRLAWAARVRRASPEIDVFHGPWVETREDCFFEAAWDGDFKEGRFDRAATMIGTGARITGDGVLFCVATDLYTHMFSTRNGTETWFSNSFVHLLERTGDAPDPRYAFYKMDFVHARMWGVRPNRPGIRTAGGKHVAIHMFENVLVQPDLSLRWIAKAVSPEPEDFPAYRQLLSESMRTVFKNLADPARQVHFDPVVSISRGYDSTAIAALAAGAGCRRSFTFRNPSSVAPHKHDDGAANAERLGMTCIRVNREADHNLADDYQAEFSAAAPSGGGSMHALFEQELEAAVLLKGSYGDLIWTLNRRYRYPDLIAPVYLHGLSPSSMTEFRLRTGFQLFLPAFIGSLHRDRIMDISRRPEMQAWTLGVEYDRPIARRIAEEAGIPRASFGQHKQYGATNRIQLEQMKPAGREAFLRFCEKLGPHTSGGRRKLRTVDILRAPFALLYAGLSRLRLHALMRMLAPLMVVSDRRIFQRRETRPEDFDIQWGFDQIRDRYEMDRP